MKPDDSSANRFTIESGWPWCTTCCCCLSYHGGLVAIDRVAETRENVLNLLIHTCKLLAAPFRLHHDCLTPANITPRTGDHTPYAPSQPLGVGPQVYGPRSTPTPPATPFVPASFVWDASLPFDKGPINITDYNTGKPVFTVQDRDHTKHHCFEVFNLKNEMLVQVHQKARFTPSPVLTTHRPNPHLYRTAKTAARGYSFTYHTSSGVSYTIHPRGLKTDQWVMQMQGNDPDVKYQSLTYHRGHTRNSGNVCFNHNHTDVAVFTFAPPKDRTYLKGSENTVKLDIIAPTNIGPVRQYFIALWSLVKLRIDKFGL
ncbi:hypothetical protein VP01_3619g3 [Puccinia sorghi]|uniref:Uncharacterized protein n=1 Tax=Puccinia sorghi TaxID=27349 RepID=A0A0L6UUX2_9BASI|nr:hypothetical protein VP01_3619g3 [Puccinia sorghi]